MDASWLEMGLSYWAMAVTRFCYLTKADYNLQLCMFILSRAVKLV